MEAQDKLDTYFQKIGPFQKGIGLLRELALQKGLEEHLKWNAPVYGIGGKNILGIMSFKKHFGLWFFNGVFLSDPLGVLQNVQAGKTRAMRHWKFTANEQVKATQVLAYMDDAISIEKKGLKIEPKKPGKIELPPELIKALSHDPKLGEQFKALSPYRQKEFAEYISTAKRDATKTRRINTILPLILNGKGLNDKYRK